MGKPKPGTILAQFEQSRLEGGLFQGDRDFTAQDRWVREGAKKRGAKVHFFPMNTGPNPENTDGAGVDPLYGDILDPEFLSNPDVKDERLFNLECYVEHRPSKQKLMKYGVDEQKDVIFHFPFSLLEEQGLVDKFRFRGTDLGDLILWDGTWYRIDAAHRGSFFGQRISHYFTAAICNRYRHNNVPTNDLSNNCPEEEV